LWNYRSVYGGPGTGGGGVGLYLQNKLVAKSSQVGVEYVFVEIRLPQKTLLMGSVYRPPSTSVVYHLLGAQSYGLGTLEEVCFDILPGYGNVYLFGDFNVNLLDSSDGLLETFCGFLESFRLYNKAISLTRAVSGKMLDLFLASNKSEDFFQMPLSWSDHDMLFLACRQQRQAVGVVEKHVRSFRNIDLSDLLEVASKLD
jgi:hypothetical protein